MGSCSVISSDRSMNYCSNSDVGASFFNTRVFVFADLGLASWHKVLSKMASAYSLIHKRTRTAS
jgi:hypothetical protein